MDTVDLHYLVIYPVAEFFQLFVLGIYTVYGICYSYAESYYSRNVFCAGTSASFLSASVNKGRKAVFLVYIKNTATLLCVYLMTAEGEHIYILLFYVDVDVADSLYCVCVEDDTLLLTQLADFSDGLYRAYLVVGVHYRDKGCIGADCVCYVLDFNYAV